MHKFVVMCATAMSSGLVAQKIQDEATARGMELSVVCFSGLQYKQSDLSDVDLILLAPQIRGQKKEIDEFLASQGWKTSTMAIDMQDYGLIRGAVILDKALKHLAES
jgi:cellobiose-specific phosphotransferase system component IIB